MDKLKFEFLAEIYKPFNILCQKLLTPHAVQMKEKELLTDACILASSISSFCSRDLYYNKKKYFGKKRYRNTVHEESFDNFLIYEIARRKKQYISAAGRGCDRLFMTTAYIINNTGSASFYRNIIRIRKGAEIYDFTEVAAKAILYWINKNSYGFTIKNDSSIQTSERVFSEYPVLYYTTSLPLELDFSLIESYIKTEDNRYKRIDSPGIKMFLKKEPSP